MVLEHTPTGTSTVQVTLGLQDQRVLQELPGLLERMVLLELLALRVLLAPLEQTVLSGQRELRVLLALPEPMVLSGQRALQARLVQRALQAQALRLRQQHHC